MNFGSLISFITAIFVFSVMTSLSSVETHVDRRRFVFSSVFCSLLGFISDDYSFVVAFVIYIFTWICICIFRCTFRLSIDVSASLIFFSVNYCTCYILFIVTCCLLRLRVAEEFLFISARRRAYHL